MDWRLIVTSLVTVTKFLYSVPMPVKIKTVLGAKAKHKNMLIKNHTIYINKVKQK